MLPPVFYASYCEFGDVLWVSIPLRDIWDSLMLPCFARFCQIYHVYVYIYIDRFTNIYAYLRTIADEAAASTTSTTATASEE